MWEKEGLSLVRHARWVMGAQFSTEMIVHLSGLGNLDNSGVWVFPKVFVLRTGERPAGVSKIPSAKITA
jgi:hypothetical protein